MKLFPAGKKWILIFLSLTLLVSCARSCSNKGSQDQTLSLVPSHYDYLIGIDWKKLAQIPTYQERLLKKAPAEVTELLKGVQSALVALDAPEANQPPATLVLLEGSFDEKKIVSSIEEMASQKNKSLSKENFEGSTYYLSPEDPTLALCVYSPSLVLWGQIADVKEAIALAKKGGNSIRSHQELMTLFNKKNAQALVWGAGLIPPTDTKLPESAPGAGIKTLKSFAFEATYDKDLHFQFTGNAENGTEAQKFADEINASKSSMAMMMATNPLIGEVFQGVEIQQKDRAVTIHVQLKEALLKQIGEQIDKAPAMEMQPPPEESLPVLPETEPK